MYVHARGIPTRIRTAVGRNCAPKPLFADAFAHALDQLRVPCSRHYDLRCISIVALPGSIRHAHEITPAHGAVRFKRCGLVDAGDVHCLEPAVVEHIEHLFNSDLVKQFIPTFIVIVDKVFAALLILLNEGNQIQRSALALLGHFRPARLFGIVGRKILQCCEHFVVYVPILLLGGVGEFAQICPAHETVRNGGIRIKRGILAFGKPVDDFVIRDGIPLPGYIGRDLERDRLAYVVCVLRNKKLIVPRLEHIALKSALALIIVRRDIVQIESYRHFRKVGFIGAVCLAFGIEKRCFCIPAEHFVRLFQSAVLIRQRGVELNDVLTRHVARVGHADGDRALSVLTE